MEIKVLGTVSPYPKGNSNCPGFLISDGISKVMLDCGPGTSRMLSVYKDLKNLAIIISHYHPDHYADILPIAYASYLNNKLGYLDERVKVYLPEPDQIEVTKHGVDKDGWGTMWKEVENIIDYSFIKNKDRENYLEFIDYNQDANLKVGSMKITFAKNQHGINTYAAKIKSDDGVVVYSSDTGYQNNSVVNLAKDADILICESTFLRGQTREKDTHLFAHEAAKIARDANVRNLYLFHTYPELDKERYVLEAKEIFENTHSLSEGEVITLRKER